MATATPVTLTGDWSLLAATGFEWLLDLHDGPVSVAFDTTTPDSDVFGHVVASGDVLTAPTGQSIYGRAVLGTARVTLTQGNAG